MVYLWAILSFAGLLVALAGLLVVAERFLVNYGICKISVNDGEQEFEYPGGSTLLSTLQENNFVIPCACAGKGSCGYCKVIVTKGGGPLLLTETPFLSRAEKRNNVRLSCQVKVRNDMEVSVPDFLSTVKDMVKNKTYNPNLRWKFIRVSQPESILEEDELTDLEPAVEETLVSILEECKGIRGPLIPVLQRLNSSYKYLSEPALRFVADKLEAPLSEVYRIATFYNAFSLKPRGKYVINICTGTACHVKGAAGIVSVFERELGIETGNTTRDMLFSLEAVRCIGCCGLAPVLTVNEDVHGLMTTKKVPELIKMYKKES